MSPPGRRGAGADRSRFRFPRHDRATPQSIRDVRAADPVGGDGLMRVAYVCADPGVPVFGHKGCSVHVREVCSTMREAGCDVTLFAARRGGDAPKSLQDLPVVALPAPSSRLPEERELEALAANEEVMRALEGAGPFDIIYERAALWTVSP